jgi:hypothetical protein
MTCPGFEPRPSCHTKHTGKAHRQDKVRQGIQATQNTQAKQGNAHSRGKARQGKAHTHGKARYTG